MRVARIENDVVVDLWDVPSLTCYAEGTYHLVLAEDPHICIDSSYIDGVFTNPPVRISIPQNISSFQAKAALLNAGLLDEVEAYLIREDTPSLFKLAWKEVQSFDRSSPAILSIAAAVGISDTQLDEMFILGAKITV